MFTSSSAPPALKRAHQVGEDALVADEAADAMAVELAHHGLHPGGEVGHLLDELGGEPPSQRQQRLDGDVLAEGHQLDLVVAQHQLAPGRQASWRPRRRGPCRRARARGRRCRREVDLAPPSRLAQLLRQGRGVVVVEGDGRLGPDHQARALPHGLPGQVEVPVDVPGEELRLPLVLLDDAGLHQADPQAPDALERRAHHEPAEAVQATPRRPRGPGGPRPAGGDQQRVGQESRGQHERGGHAVDRGVRRDLDAQEVLVLAVAEQAPGELEEACARAAAPSRPRPAGRPAGRGGRRRAATGTSPGRRAGGRARRPGRAASSPRCPPAATARRTARPPGTSSRAGPGRRRRP